jgi:hypothetical protein
VKKSQLPSPTRARPTKNKMPRGPSRGMGAS